MPAHPLGQAFVGWAGYGGGFGVSAHDEGRVGGWGPDYDRQGRSGAMALRAACSGIEIQDYTHEGRVHRDGKSAPEGGGWGG